MGAAKERGGGGSKEKEEREKRLKRFGLRRFKSDEEGRRDTIASDGAGLLGLLAAKWFLRVRPPGSDRSPPGIATIL